MSELVKLGRESNSLKHCALVAQKLMHSHVDPFAFRVFVALKARMCMRTTWV